MDEKAAGGPGRNIGLYVWLTVVYVVLTFTLNPVDTIAQATVGKMLAALIGPLFGKAASPDSWKPSFSTELIALLNPGSFVGFAIGYRDIQEFRHVYRAALPGLFLLAPLLLALIIPQGIWLALPAGSIIIGTLPYLLIGGALGCLTKRIALSALTKG